VTIEDILEEIVGEITDEYDREEPGVEQVADGTFRVRSTMHVDELGELFGRDLDDEDVDTVGGLLSKALGRVPIPGATAVVSGLELVAERPAGRRHRIATVLVRQVTQQVPDVGSELAGDGDRTQGSAAIGEPGPSGGAA
jgi:Mg2+/Co2+ transporter CorC